MTPVDRDTPSEHLQADLQKLEERQDTWLMTFNPKKCVTMTIGMKNPPHHIYNFCGEALESVDSHPYLGVLFNNMLTWGHHVLETCKKAQRVLGLLRRNLWGCSQEIKASAYSTLVKPVFEYASVLWDSKNQTNASRLERVQKQALDFAPANTVGKKGQWQKFFLNLTGSHYSFVRKCNASLCCIRLQTSW